MEVMRPAFSAKLSFLALVSIVSATFILSGCSSTPSPDNRGSRHTLTSQGNSSWILASWTSVDGKKNAIPDKQPPSLQIGYQGQVSGNAGINRYFGTVTVNNDILNWTALASTRMGGSDEAQASETRFMSDLNATQHVTLSGGQLVFTGKSGLKLEFVRATL